MMKLHVLAAGRAECRQLAQNVQTAAGMAPSVDEIRAMLE